jgi:hypothetical protein
MEFVRARIEPLHYFKKIFLNITEGTEENHENLQPG